MCGRHRTVHHRPSPPTPDGRPLPPGCRPVVQTLAPTGRQRGKFGQAEEASRTCWPLLLGLGSPVWVCLQRGTGFRPLPETRRLWCRRRVLDVGVGELGAFQPGDTAEGALARSMGQYQAAGRVAVSGGISRGRPVAVCEAGMGVLPVRCAAWSDRDGAGPADQPTMAASPAVPVCRKILRRLWQAASRRHSPRAHLVDQVGDEPGEVVLGQPVVQRRRQEQDLVWVEGPKRLVHHRRTAPSPFVLNRLDLEQSIPTTHMELISHQRSRSACGLPRALVRGRGQLC